ncbi:MAG: anti-sigma factor family protein [Acidobacteriota bacterium]
MNCIRARFLIYAYLDRELAHPEGEALSRHLADCRSCAARAASARGLAQLLHSRVDRTPAPPRLVARLHAAPEEPAARSRYPVFATAAALLLMILPLVSDTTPKPAMASAGVVSSVLPAEAVEPVSRRLTGTFVCLECEARSEAGLCPISHASHETGFCAENGELWRLMPVNRGEDSVQASLGRTATVEGVAFPESGFMRVSRVGY